MIDVHEFSIQSIKPNGTSELCFKNKKCECTKLRRKVSTKSTFDKCRQNQPSPTENRNTGENISNSISTDMLYHTPDDGESFVSRKKWEATRTSSDNMFAEILV